MEAGRRGGEVGREGEAEGSVRGVSRPGIWEQGGEAAVGMSPRMGYKEAGVP